MKRFVVRYFELQDPRHARWLSMEGLRGIAVTLVFFVHYSTGMGRYFPGGVEGTDWLRAIHSAGNSGVDLFFVLSGFLIYRAVVRRPTNYLDYAGRRAERIYPTFLAVFALYMLLSYAFPAQSKLPDATPDAMLYILANLLLLPGIFPVEPVITVAWSLSYEVLYYIAVPLLVGLLGLRGWPRSGRMALFAAIFAAFVAVQWLGYPTRFRLTLFLGGILLYELSQAKGRDRRLAPAGAADWLALAGFVAGLAVFTAMESVSTGDGGAAPGGVPPLFKYVALNAAFVFLVYRCLFADGVAARLFAFAPLRWLGNMSYSYYLMHSLGLHLFFGLLAFIAPSLPGSVALYVALVPLALVVTVVVSAPVYLLVERPLSLKPVGIH